MVHQCLEQWKGLPCPNCFRTSEQCPTEALLLFRELLCSTEHVPLGWFFSSGVGSWRKFPGDFWEEKKEVDCSSLKLNCFVVWEWGFNQRQSNFNKEKNIQSHIQSISVLLCTMTVSLSLCFTHCCWFRLCLGPCCQPAVVVTVRLSN